MAKIIHTNGVSELIEDLSLESLQRAVGGYVEIVTPKTPWYGDLRLVVNEEGRVYCLERNQRASEIAGFEIVGDCVLVQVNELG